ncbi:MAG: hypothetical protein NTY53_21130, partial [Kiritimatiellaeota bacterium]|nr:hypothetical protein [Kiritimatiellota bacterium]
MEIRNNLNALKELIDADPPGQVGPAGPAGRDGTDGGVGPAGPAGRDGIDGGQGPQGEQGPPGNDGRALVGVVDNGLGQVELQMSDGTNYGPFTVASGPQGIQGPQGPMGEVSAQQLADAIGTTSANTNSVATLDTSMSDPAMETLRQ